MIENDTIEESVLREFSRAEKRGVYKAIYRRRDVRGYFLLKPIQDRSLRRLLDAAHHAGSVGFMQLWSFIVIRGEQVKTNVSNLFEKNQSSGRKGF